MPDVLLVGVIDVIGQPTVVVIEQRVARPNGSSCGGVAKEKERPSVTFGDLARFGRPVRFVWRKHRW